MPTACPSYIHSHVQAHNFEEFNSHVVARLWQLQNDGMLNRSNTIVIGTPAGERYRPFVPNLLKPLLDYAVVTFAEFSERHQPADGSGPRTTPSGKPERCFQRAYLCAWGDSGWMAGMYNAQQEIYKYYEPSLPPSQAVFDGGDDVFKVSRTHVDVLGGWLL